MLPPQPLTGVPDVILLKIIVMTANIIGQRVRVLFGVCVIRKLLGIDPVELRMALVKKRNLVGLIGLVWMIPPLNRLYF